MRHGFYVVIVSVKTNSLTYLIASHSLNPQTLLLQEYQDPTQTLASGIGNGEPFYAKYNIVH